jgi:S1-C subfamily serine protease
MNRALSFRTGVAFLLVLSAAAMAQQNKKCPESLDIAPAHLSGDLVRIDVASDGPLASVRRTAFGIVVSFQGTVLTDSSLWRGLGTEFSTIVTNVNDLRTSGEVGIRQLQGSYQGLALVTAPTARTGSMLTQLVEANDSGVSQCFYAIPKDGTFPLQRVEVTVDSRKIRIATRNKRFATGSPVVSLDGLVVGLISGDDEAGNVISYSPDLINSLLQSEAMNPPWLVIISAQTQYPIQETTPRFAGVIVDSKGYAITTAEAMNGLGQVQVKLSDGSQGGWMPASVLGTNRAANLSVIKIKTDGTPLPTAKLGNSDALRPGDLLRSSLLRNVESLLKDDVVAQRVVASTADQIELRAFVEGRNALDPGIPLVNEEGEVVAISEGHTITGSQASFAVPTRRFVPAYNQIIAPPHEAEVATAGNPSDLVPSRTALPDVRQARMQARIEDLNKQIGNLEQQADEDEASAEQTQSNADTMARNPYYAVQAAELRNTANEFRDQARESRTKIQQLRNEIQGLQGQTQPAGPTNSDVGVPPNTDQDEDLRGQRAETQSNRQAETPSSNPPSRHLPQPAQGTQSVSKAAQPHNECLVFSASRSMVGYVSYPYRNVCSQKLWARICWSPKGQNRWTCRGPDVVGPGVSNQDVQLGGGAFDFMWWAYYLGDTSPVFPTPPGSFQNENK